MRHSTCYDTIFREIHVDKDDVARCVSAVHHPRAVEKEVKNYRVKRTLVALAGIKGNWNTRDNSIARRFELISPVQHLSRVRDFFYFFFRIGPPVSPPRFRLYLFFFFFLLSLTDETCSCDGGRCKEASTSSSSKHV